MHMPLSHCFASKRDALKGAIADFRRRVESGWRRWTCQNCRVASESRSKQCGNCPPRAQPGLRSLRISTSLAATWVCRSSALQILAGLGDTGGHQAIPFEW